jgi:hypothetical protein
MLKIGKVVSVSSVLEGKLQHGLADFPEVLL